MPDAIGPGAGAKPRPIGSLWGYGRRVAQGSGFLGEVRTLSKWSGSSLSFMNWSKVMSRAMANAGVSTKLGNGSVDKSIYRSGEKRRIGGLKEPRGVAYWPDHNELVVASAGDGTVRFFDASSLTPDESMTLGDDADNVRVDPKTGQVVVGYGSGALAILDPVRRAVVRTIARRASGGLSDRWRRPKGVRECSQRAQNRRRRFGLRSGARELARRSSRKLSHGPRSGFGNRRHGLPHSRSPRGA